MDVRRIASAAALVGVLVTGTALADHRHADFRHAVDRHSDFGRVVEVEPIVRRIVVERPRQECWQDVEYRSTAPGRIAGTTLAGGVIGAAIGRQFGGGKGRDALTMLGALAGSAVASEHARRNIAREGDEVVAVPVQRCTETVERVAEDYVEGYWVTYRYRGRLNRIRMREHPGDRVRLQVTARPVGF